MSRLALHDFDLDSLYQFWIQTGLHPLDFFAGLGIEDDAAALKNLSKDWRWELARTISATDQPPPEWVQSWSAGRPTGQMAAGDIRATPFLRTGEVEVLDAAAPGVVDPDEAHLKQTQRILALRERQALIDHCDTRTLRKLYRDKVASAYWLNPANNQLELRVSWQDLRHAAGLLLDIQKIQRLALGMSSENLGFPLRGVDSGGAQLPIVEVRITKKPTPAALEAAAQPGATGGAGANA